MVNSKYGLEWIITIDLTQKIFKEHALHLYKAGHDCIVTNELEHRSRFKKINNQA